MVTAIAQPTSQNWVYFYGHTYLLEGDVLRQKASQYADALRNGAPDRQDQQFASEVTWDRLVGGMGVFNMDEREDPDRFTDSDAETSIVQSVMLPANRRTQTVAGNAFDANPVGLSTYGGFSYIAGGTRLKRVTGVAAASAAYLDNIANIWRTTGGTEYSLPANAASEPVIWKGNLYIPVTTKLIQVNLTTAVATEVTSGCASILAIRLFIFDEDLQIITSAGAFNSTSDNGTTVGLTPHGSIDSFSNINAAFSHLNFEQVPAVWVITDRGVYIQDYTLGKFYHIIEFKDGDPNNGKGGTVWDGSPWHGKGANMNQIVNGARVVRGPAVRDGLVQEKLGYVVASDNSFDNFLIAAIDGGGVSTQYSTIWKFTRKGWHQLAQTALGARITFVRTVASGVISSPSLLYYNEGLTLKYIRIYDVTDNPNTYISKDFQSSGYVIKPWFDAGLAEVDKPALSYQIRTKDCNSTDTVIPYFAFDDNQSWTQFYDENGNAATVSTNGAHTLHFNSEQLGRLFFNCRIKYNFASGDATRTPKVVFDKIRYLRELPVLYRYDFTIDLTQNQPDQRTPSQAIVDLDLAVESRLLGRFAYHAGKVADTRTVLFLTYSGPTGSSNFRGGKARITVIELVSTSLCADDPNNPFDEETITLSTGSVSALDQNKAGQCAIAFITISGGSMRFWVDGSSPTVSNGHLLQQNNVVQLNNHLEAVNFRAIATYGSPRLTVTYIK